MENTDRNPIVAVLPIQRQLWLLQQAAPTVGIANISARYQWHGPMDILAFHESTADYVARHPFLRTTVETSPEYGLVQIGHKPTGLPITIHDIRHMPDAERQSELERLFCQATETPIENHAVPWIRVVVIRIEDERFEVAYVFSHLICDGISMGILCRESLQAYDARIQGQPPEWSHAIDDGFVEKFSNSAAVSNQSPNQSPNPGPKSNADVCDLPYDRPPMKPPRYVGNRLSFELDGIESSWLNEISRRHDVSPFVTWLSLIQSVIYQYSESNSIRIDTVMAGRDRDLRRMVGPFFKTVGIQTAVKPADTFAELLRNNKRTVEQLNAVDVHSISTSTTRSRLLLDYQASLRPVRMACGVTVIPSEWDNGAAVAELCIGIRRHKQRYHGHIKFDVDLFDVATVNRLIAHLRAALRQVWSQPDSELGSIDVLNDVERETLQAINQSFIAPVEPPVSIDQLIVRQATQSPNRQALICGAESWTYAQVIARARQIGVAILNVGVKPHDRVAIWLSRRTDSIAAMIGSMMSGAAYVPIDPNLPVYRQRLILQAADPACVVTDYDNVENVPAGLPRMLLDEAGSPAETVEAGRSEGETRRPDDIAYVLFTSGSTGVPKGVEVTHANVCNFFAGVDGLADPGVPGTWLAVTSTSFDISVFELLWTLSRGFKVVIPTCPNGSNSTAIDQFASLVMEHGVTHFQCTPALMGLLLADERNRLAVARLSKVFVGGDVLPQPLADDLSYLVRGDVFNMYGPTETTIWSTSWKIQKNETVRIGKPLPNQQVHILGRNSRRKPIGVTGELFIGGRGVCNGYFNNATETKARFLEHPQFGRLFRTGDIARVLDDGNLEFHGRNDQQIKLHGHRFELGDVEAVLVSHPEVSQAVAIIEGDNGNAKLIAHVCKRRASDPRSPDLKKFLSQRLPRYMVPSEIHVHTRLLLNGSGKIDRRAMAHSSGCVESSNQQQDPNPEYTASHRLLETQPANGQFWDQQRVKQLREIVREDLQLDSIPEDAKWSDLEISSLDIVGLVVRIERDLNIKLPVADIFRDSLIDQTLASAVGIRQQPIESTTGCRAVVEIEEGLI